jgi:hypothetical protein
MIVRIQVIKVYDVEVPDGTEDPVEAAYGLQTTEIEDTGKLIDAMTDHAQILEDEEHEDDPA